MGLIKNRVLQMKCFAAISALISRPLSIRKSRVIWKTLKGWSLSTRATGCAGSMTHGLNWTKVRRRLTTSWIFPKNTDDAAVYYYANLLKKFKEKMESYFTLKIHHDDINHSISKYNAVLEKVQLFLQK